MRRRTKWAALTGALLLTGTLASCAFDNGELGGDDTVERALDYYRLKGVQDGVRLGPPQLSDPTTVVSWDDPLSGSTVLEPVVHCPEPPLPEGGGRCVNEPAGTTVAQLRERHATVFQVHFRSESYFQVSWETHEKN
ncbi:hypothetical protein ACH41E_01830 [Streptomyces sp. NPDC020412]|uniref:hypothetical protein n=1 Tax=Streptomyces sp. NPDC020412 TaxID=3365073 RepID=UPI00378A478D